MLLSVMVMGTGAVTLTDSEDISPQYREAAEVLTGMGIINGYEDDSFKPQQSITRAEVAAMIYRVATGDVEDEKADINAGAKIFTDVDPDDWYAGYVNYCGDAEYIKGFEDDSFRADENVTGYQVLAMILRAVGYDKNNEFTGTNWTINVASTAAEVGMLKNVDSSVNLSAEAPRELVAEFIFQAVRPVAEDSQTQLVHWSPAAGDYRPDNAWNPESLGEKVFNLDVENDADMWGRPNIEWFNDKTDDVYAAIEIDPVATYTTAVNDCDVYEDTGISGQRWRPMSMVRIPSMTSTRPLPRRALVPRVSWWRSMTTPLWMARTLPVSWLLTPSWLRSPTWRLPAMTPTATWPPRLL